MKREMFKDNGQKTYSHSLKLTATADLKKQRFFVPIIVKNEFLCLKRRKNFCFFDYYGF